MRVCVYVHRCVLSWQVYLIDFGLSKRYVEPRTNQHIPYRTGKSLTGLISLFVLSVCVTFYLDVATVCAKQGWWDCDDRECVCMPIHLGMPVTQWSERVGLAALQKLAYPRAMVLHTASPSAFPHFCEFCAWFYNLQLA